MKQPGHGLVIGKIYGKKNKRQLCLVYQLETGGFWDGEIWVTYLKNKSYHQCSAKSFKNWVRGEQA